MASTDDDPFTTLEIAQDEHSSDPDFPPDFGLPQSPQQIRMTLQSKLAETRKRMEGAGQLGRDLVQQEQLIEARLQELEDSGSRINPELRKKMLDLERDYVEVGRETARAFLTNKVMTGAGSSIGPVSSPFVGSNISSPSTFQTHGSHSPSKLNVPSSRRQRNQSSKSHDLEFAAELGQGLIAEVRKLQGLLSEKEETMRNIQEKKLNLEHQLTNAESHMKSMFESELRQKEDNWNMELMLQEFKTKNAEQKENITKLQVTISQLSNEKDAQAKELEELTLEYAAKSEQLDRDQTRQDAEIISLRKRLEHSETDRESLARNIEVLKEELDLSQKISIRLRHLDSRAELKDRQDSHEFSNSEDNTPEHSPPASPTKQTPRHGMLENETLKSSLHHAHRMVTSLKSNIHREKTEKAELKRLLQETRDELEAMRSTFNEKTVKRRKGDGTFKKPLKANIVMLGGVRKSREEIFIENSPDDDWEDNPDENGNKITDLVNTSAFGVPRSGTESDPIGFESHFKSPNEKDLSDAFETANEAATETDAYRTGIESPAYDNPTSADELTETEEASWRTLKAKASQISGRSLKSLKLNKTRSRQRIDSITSTASTEDEGLDQQYRYGSSGIVTELDRLGTPDDRYDEEPAQPRMISNPRLKLRINRALSRGSRVPSENSLFNAAPFHDIGSSPTSMSDSSPIGIYIKRQSIIGIRKTLFAELGDTSDMNINDGGYTPNNDDAGTPTKLLRPQVGMCDAGVMTVVPYPNIDTEELPERHATAIPGQAVPLFENHTERMSATPMLAVSGAASGSPIEKMDLMNDHQHTASGRGLNVVTDPIGFKSNTISQFESEKSRPSNVFTVTTSDTLNTTTNRELSLNSSSNIEFGPSLETVSLSQNVLLTEQRSAHFSEASPVVFFGTTAETVPSEAQTPVLAASHDLSPTNRLVENLEFSFVNSISTKPDTPNYNPERAVVESTRPITTSMTSMHDVPESLSKPIGDIHVANDEMLRNPPINVERKGFFESISNARKERPVEFDRVSEQEKSSLPASQKHQNESQDEDTIRKRDIRRRPALPVPVLVSDRIIQTDISHEFFDKLEGSTQPKRPALASSIADSSGNNTPSIRSRVSQEGVSHLVPNNNDGGRLLGVSSIGCRGGSASLRDREATRNSQWPPLPSNHQQQIAAAVSQKTPSLHGDTVLERLPLSVHRIIPSPNARPCTPDQPHRAETPNGSRGGLTPKARLSSFKSELSSPGSRRSSLSSFASELDDRFNMQSNGYTARQAIRDQPTDPTVIQAITQTMIGEYLWKYTRATGRGTISHTRHRRFFWVHPYTRTLYWSDRDPQTAGRNELRAKSVAIEAVKVVADDNPMPPGLHRKSLIVVTPGRSLKFTAPTAPRHETWFSALSYLLLRSGEHIQDETVGFDEEDINDFDPALNTRHGTTSISSYHSRTDSNPRTTSSLSIVRSAERDRIQGSISRLSNMFRHGPGLSTFSSRTSRQPASVYHSSDVSNSGDDSTQAERDLDRMENVRACCDGKHDVGTLSRKGGRKTPVSFGGRHSHVHSHV